jgi:hypothetical protein
MYFRILALINQSFNVTLFIKPKHNLQTKPNATKVQKIKYLSPTENHNCHHALLGGRKI